MGENERIAFTKMAGTGNDFIVIDDTRTARKMDWKAFAARHCTRRTGVGADGVLVLTTSADTDFCLRIFNADGSEAEMCGNGARCAAAFALERGIAHDTMRFSTLAGPIEARVEGAEVRLRMTPPVKIQPHIAILIDSHEYCLFSIDTGVPHAILFHDDIASLAVDTLGRGIRLHTRFAPAGTNVDFVQVTGVNRIRVRTYERGVEAETLACGTGAVASALMAHRFRGVSGPPVYVNMPGGELKIDFTFGNGTCTNAWLIGAVETIYSAELHRR